LSEAVIVAAEIIAGHDGRAELVVQVRHENGVIAPVVLDGDTGLRLLNGAGADDIDALVGQSWRDVLANTVLGGT
jgi:hypothetical protein